MSATLEINGDKQTVEGSLTAVHQRLRCYTNDQIAILDDIMFTIESFYKTEKHTHEKMKGSLQKSLEHVQKLSYLGSSVIGSAWSTALKELTEHYAQREAFYPILKQVILESLRKIRNEKLDEHNQVLLYDDEIIKEMTEIERRTMKTKRVYDDVCERLRQKESGIKRLQQKIRSKNEVEIEVLMNDARNMYILQVKQMNFALKFYIEQFLVDLDKLLVCDLFPQVKQVLDDLVYSEYKRFQDTLQRAISIAVEDGDAQKRRLIPKTFQNYPLILSSDQSDQINIDSRFIPQLSSAYVSAINDVRDTDQQIQLALESSVLNAQQNKDSRMDSGKIRLKRMEMRKAMASFIIDILETLVPNIKTAPISARPTRIMGGLKPLMSVGRIETNPVSIPSSTSDTSITGTLVDLDSAETYLVPTPTFPCQAIVLYDFESANDDEMSVRKDEKIFIQSKPEYDGWLIAKGRERSGLVPESYVQLIPTLPTAEPGVMKNSASVRTKSNAVWRSTEAISDASMMSSSPSAAADEGDYFSDD